MVDRQGPIFDISPLLIPDIIFLAHLHFLVFDSLLANLVLFHHLFAEFIDCIFDFFHLPQVQLLGSTHCSLLVLSHLQVKDEEFFFVFKPSCLLFCLKLGVCLL